MIDKQHNNFGIKDLRILNFFGGIKVVKTSEGFHLSQKKYIH